MKYRTGPHSISEEEIRANEKYLRIRGSIKVEELATMFEKGTQIRLQKYNKVFEQIEKIEGEGFFSRLNTTVNMQKLKEITIKFFGLISPEWGKEVEDIFNETNTNVQLVICGDNEKFMADHSKIKITGGGIQMPEEMVEKFKKDNPELYNEISKDRIMTYINLSLTNSLSDIYNLVHEITHYFTFRDTATERIFSEVAPQCMERTLDDFLLQLSDEELNKYSFKKEELIDDIRKRRIITFTSRYKATKDFNEKNKKNNFGDEEEELLKYFLAQFFQSQFRKYDVKDKKKKIIEFIEYVKNDNFEVATKTLGVDWSNGLKRSFCIDNMIEDIKTDLEAKPKDRTKNNKKGETEREQR